MEAITPWGMASLDLAMPQGLIVPIDLYLVYSNV